MRSLLVIPLLLAGCDGCGVDDLDTMETGETGDSDLVLTPASEDWERDLLHTALAVDLDTHNAVATITIAASDSTGSSFEAQGLDVRDVYAPDGPLDWSLADGALHVGLPAGGEDPVVIVEYGFSPTSDYDGWSEDGYSFVWPYFCGNLFPCHSDPADGLSFELSVSTDTEGQVVVYPQGIPADAPSYQIAWVQGLYERLDLGTSAGGVELVVWYSSGNQGNAAVGTQHLLEAWDWFETTLGPYPFGDVAGSVEVDWGPGAYGGMEHHPLSHVGSGSMSDRITHIHEAAHGWFGGGVRIACWEDFVLSEGTVTYLTARAIAEVIGEQAGEEVWDEYDDALEYAISYEVIESWPEGCGEVDVIDDGLFSLGPYYKGSHFYRLYAEQVGVRELDAAIGSFYQDRAGSAATMQEMIDHLHIETGVDPMPLAEAWLRGMGWPDEA